MSHASSILPEDPAFLKAMITALQAENAKISAALKAHDHLIQGLRLRIARLKKQVFGKSSEKIEREIAQLELALEDLLIASAEHETATVDELEDDLACARMRHHKPDRCAGVRACRKMPFANAGNWIPVIAALPAVENCAQPPDTGQHGWCRSSFWPIFWS
jgi:hypothetical protein